MDSKVLKSLKAARRQIDSIDGKIISQLAARMAVSKKIGILKSKNNIPIVQKTRWKDLMKDRFKRSKKLGLNLKTVDNIFRLVQKESVAIQKKVKRK